MPASQGCVPFDRSCRCDRGSVRKPRSRSRRYRPDPGHGCRADLRHRRLGRRRNRNLHRQTGDLYGGGRDRPDARDSGDARRRHQPGKPAGAIRCTRGTGMRGSAENATTPSSTPTSRPPRSCFRTPCCNGKILGPATDAASSRNIAASIRTFNDDLQGTGAITLAAAVSAMRICGTLLRNQRIVIFGAGVAGIGIADLIRDVMIDEGLSAEEADAAVLVRGRARAAHQRYGRPVARLSGNLCPPRRRGEELESARAPTRTSSAWPR